MNHYQQIASRLQDAGLDAMLITSEPGEFYAMGFHGEGVAVITPDKTWYYTDTRYIEAAQQIITGPAEISLPPAKKNYRTLTQDIVASQGIQKIGFEDGSMSVAEHKKWTTIVKAEFVPCSKMLTEMRMVKDADELAAMREAQRLTDEAFTEILNYVKPGVTESEIAARLTYIMASKGALRNSFDPIVAAGANGSKPHAIPGNNVIEAGQFVTMDFGCVVNGYCSDMTRTVVVGTPTDEMKLVYHTVLQAQLAGIAAAKGGVTGDAVHRAAADVISAAGYGNYFGHGFGHSLGIEIHEEPRFSPTWKKAVPTGATLSAEPGIYLPGKFGVRIEDVLWLRDDGCEILTHSPKEMICL